MINTSCNKCGREIVILNGWYLHATETLTKRTKAKERCFAIVDGRIVTVEPNLYLPQGQTIYKVHTCQGMR